MKRAMASPFSISMAKPKVTVYFDLQSPYSYLAYYSIRRSNIFTSCDVFYVPIDIGGLVKAGNGTPPWGNPNKVKYIERDLVRSAQYMGIPWRPGFPSSYPTTRTRHVQRAIAACTDECSDEATAVIDALYSAFWIEKKAVQLPKEYEPIIKDVLGEPLGTVVLNKSMTEDASSLLKRNTEQAIARGACGLPWIVATKGNGETEDFWGADRVPHVASFLGLDKESALSRL